MEVPQLRSPGDRQEGSRRLPRLRSSPELLRDRSQELLIEYFFLSLFLSPNRKTPAANCGGCFAVSSTLERDNVQAVNHLVHRVIRGALPRFSGVRGIEIPRNRFFSCTVNGTFSFWRDKKRMWGWNCGFRKMPRYDWQRAVRTKYVKRISALRTNLFRRSLRRGTFHRRKVPKDRWGVSMRPRPLATPQAPEGCMPGAF